VGREKGVATDAIDPTPAPDATTFPFARTPMPEQASREGIETMPVALVEPARREGVGPGRLRRITRVTPGRWDGAQSCR
jgi:hypothetical protein